MVAVNRGPEDRLRAALQNQDTFPPGTLVRLKTSPNEGPVLVVGVVTIEKWGGDFITNYEFTRELKGLFPFTHTFITDAANVFVKPGDNPAIVTAAPCDPCQPELVPAGTLPAGLCAEVMEVGVPWPEGAAVPAHAVSKATPLADMVDVGLSHPVPLDQVGKPLTHEARAPGVAFDRASSSLWTSQCGRFSIRSRPGGYIARDHASRQESKPFRNRQAAEHWCQMWALEPVGT